MQDDIPPISINYVQYTNKILSGTYTVKPCMNNDLKYALIILYTTKNIFQTIIFLDSPRHYMRAWIRVLDAPGCYERAARAERKSALQGSGLVRTVGPCAQRRVALMPRAIATARDALSARKRRAFREAC